LDGIAFAFSLEMGFTAIFSLKISRRRGSLSVLEAADAITQAWQA
jgi:hypothetical protein